MTSELYQRSIEVIKENQSSSGAYPACPRFPIYGYSWFRDGAYIAYAMDLVGEHDSARRFHQWAAGVIARRRQVISRAAAYVGAHGRPSERDYLHARYTLDGEEAEDDWPNYQLDGVGSWLWALEKHARLSGSALPENFLDSARLAADYLNALWPYPCSDSWEEFPDRIHTYTLAAIYGGIRAYGELTGDSRDVLLAELKGVIDSQVEGEGVYRKFIGTKMVDANLLGISTPYRMVAPGHPVMAATADQIKQDLVRDDGLHRYVEDTYYGGGAWVLLSAWLGWYWVERGEYERARELLAWVEDQADEKGWLPEQVPVDLNDPAYYPIWRERWGEIAKPLLWSHAMYLILVEKLGSAEKG